MERHCLGAELPAAVGKRGFRGRAPDTEAIFHRFYQKYAFLRKSVLVRPGACAGAPRSVCWCAPERVLVRPGARAALLRDWLPLYEKRV